MLSKKMADKKVYAWYTILYIIISMVVFGQLLIFDKTLIWDVDGYLQWYPLFVKFQNSFRDLFTGNGFTFWDWSIGLGSDYLSNFAFIIFDPFSYLALFFSNAHADIAYSFVIIAKLYAAGFVVLRYLKYHGKRNSLCVIGAVGYAFCLWGLIVTRHSFFITQMIIFPILILGVDKVEDRRSPSTLILGVFWSMLQSIYFSYMSALFVGIYVLVIFFTSEEEKTVGRFLIKMGRYVLYAFTGGVLMAAPVLVPALYTLMQTSKESGVAIQILPTFKQMLRIVPSVVSQQDAFSNYSTIGMNILFAAMIPAICMQIKQKKTSACMFGVTVLFFLLPVLQSVTNGFSYASGRWCYVINFFFMYAAIECLEWKKIWEKSYLKWIFLTMMIFFVSGLAAYLIFGAISTVSLLVLTINVIFGTMVCYVWQERESLARKRGAVLIILVSINCAVLGFLYYNPQTRQSVDTLMNSGLCYQVYESNSMRAVENIQDTEFYRVGTIDYPNKEGQDSPLLHTPSNVSLYWNAPTVAEYLSTLDAGWLEWNHLLGNNSGYYRRMCSYSNDNRARMDFLLGVKYFMGTDKEKEAKVDHSGYAGYGFTKDMETDGVSVLKSSKNTSLGYVYESAVSDEEFITYSPLEREQILMQSVQMETKDMDSLQHTKEQDASALQFEESKGISCRIKAGAGMKLSKKKKKFSVSEASRMTIQLEQEVSNSEIYVIFKNLHKKSYDTEALWALRTEEEQSDKVEKGRFVLSRMSETDYGNLRITVTRDGIQKRVANMEGEAQGISGIQDYMVNMGYVERFDGKIICEFHEPGEYTYDAIQVVAVPAENFEHQAENLEKNRLNVTQQSNNCIKGTVDTRKGGLLYLSILYNAGWKVFVDGEEADTVYRVNTAFMGVEVPEGQHDIVLKYRPLGMPYTIVLFGIGVIVLGLLNIPYLRRKKTHEEGVDRNRTV